MTEPENIGDIFTKEGIRKVNVGQTLTFEQDGERKTYRVVRRNLKKHKLLVRPVQLYKFSEDGKEIVKD